MPSETEKVDMSRHQRPFERGPRAIENLEAEYLREFPAEPLTGPQAERLDAMEAKLRDKAAKLKAEKGAGA